MDHNLQILGIAKKAGFLAVGAEASSAAARNGKAVLIIAANDTSDSAERHAQRDSEFCGAAFAAVPYTRFELGSITGRGSPGTIAILDTGLASTFIGALAKDDPVRYGETAEALAERHRRSLIGKKHARSGERRAAAEKPQTSGGERRAAADKHARSGERRVAAEKPQTSGGAEHTTSGKRRTAL